MVAVDEVQAVLSLVEFGVGGSARLASDIFDNVLSQNVLDLLLLETTYLKKELVGKNTGTKRKNRNLPLMTS